MALGGGSKGVTSSVALLVACVVLIHSEQNLLAPNMSAVASSFGMSDADKDQKLGGGLAASLFLVGAPAAVLVGMAADGWARRVDLLVLVLLQILLWNSAPSLRMSSVCLAVRSFNRKNSEGCAFSQLDDSIEVSYVLARLPQQGITF